MPADQSRWFRMTGLNSSRTTLLKTVVGQYGIWAANLLIPLAISPYIARVLGPAGVGLYGFCQAVAGYPLLVIEYGFVMSGTRAIAETSDSRRISAIFSRVTASKLLLAGIAVVFTLVSGLWIEDFQQSPTLLFLVVGIAVANGFHPEWYFRGRERLLKAAAVTAIVKLLTIPAILVWVRQPSDMVTLMMIQTVASVITTAVLLIMSGELKAFYWPSGKDLFLTLKEGGWLFLMTVSQTITGIFTPILLKSLTSMEAVGFYYIASRIQGPFWVLLSPLIIAIFPRMVSRIGSDPLNGTKLALRVSLATTGLACLAAMFLGIFAEQLILIFAGRGYEPAITTLRVLALLIPFIAGNTAIGNLMVVPHRQEKLMLPITLVCGLVVVGSALFLVPQQGHSGMAIALVIGEATKLVMSCLLARSSYLKLLPHQGKP